MEGGPVGAWSPHGGVGGQAELPQDRLGDLADDGAGGIEHVPDLVLHPEHLFRAQHYTADRMCGW